MLSYMLMAEALQPFAWAHRPIHLQDPRTASTEIHHSNAEGYVTFLHL